MDAAVLARTGITLWSVSALSSICLSIWTSLNLHGLIAIVRRSSGWGSGRWFVPTSLPDEVFGNVEGIVIHNLVHELGEFLAAYVCVHVPVCMFKTFKLSTVVNTG